MRCPFCNYEQDKVVDSRGSKEGRAIRRRRECLKCGKRFTTYEYIETVTLSIIKNDKRREPYDRSKILQGLTTACKKRPISMKKIESIVDTIEDDIAKLSKIEIPSSYIGKLVMDELFKLDEVAYVRFASVYRKFKDKGEFISQVKELDSREEPRLRSPR
ncbi:MAG: transcriptional regulator NrdR [Chitinivibrionales bacterium]|nr:transcriptional regulator NrdR [Chitinivibrionales bacterium]